REQRDIAPQVASDFGRARRLDVEHARYPRVDLADVDRTGGFQRDLVAGVAQALQQADTALLRQRLATGDADVADTVPRDLGEDAVVVPPLAAMEGVGGVAVLAAQRATGQAHEHRRPADAPRLALQ